MAHPSKWSRSVREIDVKEGKRPLAASGENPWRGRVVLLTGVAGTVGREILSQLVGLGCANITGIDINESELFFVERECAAFDNLKLALTDISDVNSLTALMDGADVVIHAAGLKHVGLCERSPGSAIRTNILGTQNVIQAAMAAGVERVLFTSSDKAVNPTSVMGTSKLMAERLMTAANAQSHRGRPIFVSGRFGNVLGSRGSVIPLLRQQIAAGGPVTLTDPRMTRFIMTLSQAVILVMEVLFMAQGGEVFVTKMPVCRIEDLVITMVEELAPRYGFDPQNVPIQVVGASPGEKFYEELMNEEELRRAVELDDYFVIMPAFHPDDDRAGRDYPGTFARQPEQPYNSSTATAMDRDVLRRFLHDNHFLDS
jgi:FlaA1/EpsC-like NDP-sugar epimerase